MVKAIRSLGELSRLAREFSQYADLAKSASRNLGGPGDTLEGALKWLNLTADETSEEGVVSEVNFLI